MTELRDDVRMTLRPVALLVDVDDTLLDNDRIRADFEEHLEGTYGSERRDAYWAIQERLFAEPGYRDDVGDVQEVWSLADMDPQLLGFSEYLLEYPYADRLYAGALEVLSRLRAAGPVIVLTDGAATFHPRQ